MQYIYSVFHPGSCEECLIEVKEEETFPFLFADSLHMMGLTTRWSQILISTVCSHGLIQKQICAAHVVSICMHPDFNSKTDQNMKYV